MATAAEALREADRLKSSLLSSVSHELKTPLAALTATVSNLLEGDVPWNEKSVRDELRAIVTDVARLNNSIGALLDLSRLEARAWEPHRELYELPDILAASLGALPVHQRSRVTIDLPDDLAPLHVDFEQWVRVFQNLLENAMLYAGAGPLRVGAQATGDGLRLWVEDEGPGIPADEHEAVFEKFYRGRPTGTKVRSGTGLGLAITREIVRAHGGSHPRRRRRASRGALRDRPADRDDRASRARRSDEHPGATDAHPGGRRRGADPPGAAVDPAARGATCCRLRRLPKRPS